MQSRFAVGGKELQPHQIAEGIIFRAATGISVRADGLVPLCIKVPGLRVVIELVERIGTHHPTVRTARRTPFCVHILNLAHVAPHIFVPSPGDARLVRAATEPIAVAEKIPLRLLPTEIIVFVGKSVQSVSVRYVVTVKVQKQPSRDTSIRIVLNKMLRDVVLAKTLAIRGINYLLCPRAISKAKNILANKELNKGIRNASVVPQLDPPFQIRISPFTVKPPTTNLSQAACRFLVCEVLYLRTVRILRMVPLARIAARVRLYDTHKPPPESEHVPDAPVRRIRMGRLPSLKTLVLKTVVDMSMCGIRFLEREDSFR